jgi:dihydropteroate synthase
MAFNPYVMHLYEENDLLQEFREVGSTEAGNRIMLRKGRLLTVHIEGVSLRAANLLKQEALARGGDAAVHRGVGDLSVDSTDVILMVTLGQLEQLIEKLSIQPFRLKRLAEELRLMLDRYRAPRVRTLSCGPYPLTVGQRTLIMGIVNVTPDSFSDGGRYATLDQAVAHAVRLVEEGADILDIGGESTRPGYTPVDEDEELRRVIPVIETLAGRVNVPISIDSYKPSVAERAIQAGAHIINDIWGLRRDRRMAEVAARYGCPVVVMHNRDTPHPGSPTAAVRAMIRDLQRSVAIARETGISDDRIILDPGIGFGKTHEQNLEVMRRLRDVAGLGFPVLLGPSRKSMIGRVLGLPTDQRVEGTAAAVAFGICGGVDIVRVHDVQQMVRVARMMDAMLGRGNREETAVGSN